MMTSRRSLRTISLLILIFLMITGCQSAQAGSSTATTSSTGAVSTTPISTQAASQSSPQNALTAYFDAYKARDFDKLLSLVSTYSLNLTNAKIDDLRAFLVKDDMAGFRVLDYKLLDTKTYSVDAVIIRTILNIQGTDEKSSTVERWSGLHREEGQWRVNLTGDDDNSLIDDLPISVQPQTISQIEVQPMHLLRFVKSLILIVSIGNNADRTVYWGWAGSLIATFHFGTAVHTVSGKQYVSFQSGQNDPSAFVQIDGSYDQWPDSVDLSGWQLASARDPSLPDPSSGPWSYTFSLK